MTLFRSRTAAALAAAAALSLSATPAMARGWNRHHDRGGLDAGDVFGGLLIIGGVAAIASAVSKSNKDRQARDNANYPDQARYYDQYYRDARGDEAADYGRDDYRAPPASSWRSGVSVDAAVDACVGEVERDRSIESVDSVNRESEGWRVSGRVRDGGDFSCSVDGSGRVRNVSGV
ncbi:hypothetical protein [Novosphingobium sp. JCM 18896]|uniref:hypothetical protein n=1 Tax=Novosphingobium sp. JCM 18896 TaxID=2989731 RepID=UPI0022224630|nr:hypothetical protein [Novosphingobium sp. JCM 18896]MCW1430005.1 hypothetical protein [Novosphingobium sp. JCM 18896]